VALSVEEKVKKIVGEQLGVDDEEPIVQAPEQAVIGPLLVPDESVIVEDLDALEGLEIAPLTALEVFVEDAVHSELHGVSGDGGPVGELGVFPQPELEARGAELLPLLREPRNGFFLLQVIFHQSVIGPAPDYEPKGVGGGVRVHGGRIGRMADGDHPFKSPGGRNRG